MLMVIAMLMMMVPIRVQMLDPPKVGLPKLRVRVLAGIERAVRLAALPSVLSPEQQVDHMLLGPSG
jgi:hypothetical protein